jgi:predicted Zn-dependent protease
VFLQPTLRLRLDFPSGWATQNQADQVVAVSPGQDAVLTLSAGGSDAPGHALTTFFAQQGVSGQPGGAVPINGLPAAMGSFTAQTSQGTVSGWAAYVSLDGSTYQLLGYTPSARLPAYDAVLRQAIGSFQRLTDPQALSVKPQRVRLVRLGRAMTLAEFNQSYPSVVPVAQLAVINGVDANATLPAGATVKRVVVE